MPHVTAEYVKAVLKNQGCDELVAEDLKSGEQIGYHAGAIAELEDAVDFMESNFSTPYRLRGRRKELTGTPGSRKAKDREFVWTMLGLTRGTALVNGAPTGTTVIREGAPPSGAAVETARLAGKVEAEVEYLRARVKELEEQVEELDAEAEEQAAQPVQAAPPPTPLKWYEDAEKFSAVLSSPAVDKLLGAVGGMLGLRLPAPVNGPPKPPPVAAEVSQILTEEELVLLATFKRDNPDMARGMVEQLRTTLAQQAPSDGK